MAGNGSLLGLTEYKASTSAWTPQGGKAWDLGFG